ncbi:MAG: hypothetical protein V4681_03600 [Patescibacteria group bacterium]
MKNYAQEVPERYIHILWIIAALVWVAGLPLYGAWFEYDIAQQRPVWEAEREAAKQGDLSFQP